MAHPNVHRIVFYSALYDLLVTAPFATPWTATATFKLLAALHQHLGLHGSTLPDPGALSLLFVNLFGIVVLMWSGVRLLKPTVFNGAVDSIGRLTFATTMAFALCSGSSTLVAGFMILELVWLVIQGSAVFSALKGSRSLLAS